MQTLNFVFTTIIEVSPGYLKRRTRPTRPDLEALVCCVRNMREMRQMDPSFSLGSLGLRLFPQTLHVTHRGDAEEAFVLPIEVGGVVVAYTRSSACCVEVFAQHQTAGLLQSQVLLELLGTQRRDGFEAVLQTRDTHAQFVRELLDAQGPVEVLEKSLDGSGNGWGVAPRDRQVTESAPLLSHQKAIDDFPCVKRLEQSCFGRRI